MTEENRIEENGTEQHRMIDMSASTVNRAGLIKYGRIKYAFLKPKKSQERKSELMKMKFPKSSPTKKIEKKFKQKC